MKYSTEEERLHELEVLAMKYQEDSGEMNNFLVIDVDGKEKILYPQVDEDEDLSLVAEDVAKLIIAKRTDNIFFAVKMYREIGEVSHRCVMVHMCNPNEEHVYLAKRKKKGSRRYLGPFEKLDLGKVRGMFINYFDLRNKD